MSSQVQVCVRVRPFSETEEAADSRNVITVPPDSEGHLFISKPVKYLSVAEQQEKIKRRDVGSEFDFDKVFDSSNPNNPTHTYSTQQTVFDHIGRRVVETAFNAFNCTVFAYGQTGSGKTYTLMGSTLQDDQERGLVPRTCEHLFQEIQRINDENPEDTFARFKVEISFLEIYNEKVRDLLLRQSSNDENGLSEEGGKKRSSRGGSKQALRVREHPKEGVIVEGLSRHIVNDYDAVEDFLRKGNKVRVSGATHVHEQSSRSHAIFTVHFVQADISDDGIPNERVAKINLVDLAGSERADPSSDYNRERFKEGVNINKSLVSLGNVIDSLAELSQQSSSRPSAATSAKQKDQPNIHVPYRESVLTFLLRDSLGGNAYTTMIATVSPSSSAYHETISTLRYASRTQVIKNQPVKNEDPQIKLIKDLKSQVDRLKQMLEQKNGLDGVSQVIEEKMHQGQEQIDNLTQQWAQQWERQKLLLQDSATHDTTGLTVNSEFPHLVGFPNNSTKSKAFVVYQLCPGSFSIGTGDHEIGVYGSPSDEIQGVIRNERGVITLVPQKKDHQFQINSVDISAPSNLYSGCLVQLGPGNLFRYWDPKYANKPSVNVENLENMGEERLSNPPDTDLTNEAAFLVPPQFSRLRGMDRAASVMSFQSVDMEESLYGDRGDGLQVATGGLLGGRGRGNLVTSERTQSMASLLSEKEVMQKIALADSLADQLNEANRQIEDLREARENKDAQDEEKRLALEDLQFDYQEQICEHQDKIEQLLVDHEQMVTQAEDEIQHLQHKLDEKREKEKAKLDEEIQKIDKQMQQVHAKKKTAKTMLARSNLEKEEIEVMGKLKNLREREKKLKESLKSTENQIRDKEKKVNNKKKKFEEKLLKMQTELHSIKAQYLDRHMRTSMTANSLLRGPRSNSASQQKVNNLDDDITDLESETMEIEGQTVQMRQTRGRANDSTARHAMSGQVVPKSTFSQLLERRKRERESANLANEAGGHNHKQHQHEAKSCQSKMINVAIGEDDEGNPMYLKISLRGSRENIQEPDDTTKPPKQAEHKSRAQSRSIAKERALSMDLADLQKLTNFQEIDIKEPANQYESGENLLQMPSESGRNIMLQRFMNDLGRGSVSDVRSNFGQSQEKLLTSNSEINLKIERHCEAGVHIVSPNSSCETLNLEKPIKAKVVYHESKLKVDSHLHIVEPLNIASGKDKSNLNSSRRFSDYGSVSSITRGTSPTTFTSGDSVLGKQAHDEKKVLRRVINGPNQGFRPNSQVLSAYPAFNSGQERKPRPKSLYSALEFDDENRENEWDFQPLSSAQSGQIRRPFEVKQAEGHTARIGPKVTLTVTPQVTVTAIPGHILAERPHLVPRPGGDAHSPSGSSKFLKLRREMQDKQRQKPADVSQSSIRSYSVISSREDLKEANESYLRRRLYSNQPFLAEGAISNDSPGEHEVLVDSTEMWANKAARQQRRLQSNSSANSRQLLHHPRQHELIESSTPNPHPHNMTSSTSQMMMASPQDEEGENDLEIAQFGDTQYHDYRVIRREHVVDQSTPDEEPTPRFVKRRLNPNRTNKYDKKRMSWPVNKEEMLVAEMERQPLFINNYQQSEEYVFPPSELTGPDSFYEQIVIQEQLFDNESQHQDAKSNRCVENNGLVVNNPPKIFYLGRNETESRTELTTGTETEAYDDDLFSTQVYIETKSFDPNDAKDKTNAPNRNIEPEHFRFPSVANRSGLDLGREFEVSRSATNSRGGSNLNLSRATSDVFSNPSGRNLISESGTYRHIEEVFTTESIITKGQEKKTKAGKILGKWKLIKKREKIASDNSEHYLSTLEASVTPGSGKKIKFDKSLSASQNSIGSVKKLRNQASSPVEFDDGKSKRRKKVSYISISHNKEPSFTRLDGSNVEQSPKTPSSTISTQTPCTASTQTQKDENSVKTTEQHLITQRHITRISSTSRHRKSVKNSSSDSSHSERNTSSNSEGLSDGRKKFKRGKYRKYSRENRTTKRDRYGRKSKGSKRKERASKTTSTSGSSSDTKNAGKSPSKKLKDAMTNTVNEIGIQTDEVKQSVATVTDLREGRSEEIDLPGDRSNDFNMQDYLNEVALSSESVQTLTFKSTPARFEAEIKSKDPQMRNRTVSLENLPTTRSDDQKHTRPASRKKISKRLFEDKIKIYEFMMSLDSVKVEEYLQMLRVAGTSGDVLQALLHALQQKNPESIPNEVMRYFDTDSCANQTSSGLKSGKKWFEKRANENPLTSLSSFATFGTYLSIAEDVLNKHLSVSEAEKEQVLEALRKQDSSILPKSLDPIILKEIENAASALVQDEQIIDSDDTTSILESENMSASDLRRPGTANNSTPSNLLSHGGSEQNPSRESSSLSRSYDPNRSRESADYNPSGHDLKMSRIERLKQRSITASALDAFTSHSPGHSPITPRFVEDNIQESLLNKNNQLEQTPSHFRETPEPSDSRRTSNASEGFAEIVGKNLNGTSSANRGAVTSTPIDRELYRSASDDRLHETSPPTVVPLSNLDASKLPEDVQNKLAAQIVVTADAEDRDALLRKAEAQESTITMISALAENGDPIEIRDSVATLLSEPVTKAILVASDPSRCQEALTKIPIAIIANEDTSCENFSEEIRSDESLAKQIKSGTNCSAVIFVAANALMNLNKAERNFWLEKLGLYDVIKNEIKDAIARGDIDTLRKLLPEDCAKFLLENLPGTKVKNSISDEIKSETENPLQQHMVKFVAQTLVEEPLELTTEMLSTILEMDELTESAMLEAINEKDEDRLQSLLTNEIIDAIVGEISSEALVESLANEEKLNSRKKGEPKSPKNAGEFHSSPNMSKKKKEQNKRLLSGTEPSEPCFTDPLSESTEEMSKRGGPEKSQSMMTPQRIIASLLLDWEGEQILEFVSGMDPEKQNQVLDAITGGDVQALSRLIEKDQADKILKDFNLDIIPVIEKAQERFKDPEKLLEHESVQETQNVLNTLVETFKNDKENLKDILARLDVGLATKMFDALNSGDLIAAKALLISAAKANAKSNLSKHQALSDSAIALSCRPRRLSDTLFSKSESELTMKPKVANSVSKEVLGDFYEEAQKLGSQSRIVYLNVEETVNKPTESGPMQNEETSSEPVDLDIPDELAGILEKYVHPDDVFGLYDAYLHNPALIAENLPAEDVEKLYEDISAYDDRREQKLADLLNVAADTLKSLFPQEMDDLVEKMQQSMPEPDDVTTFCDHVKNGEFEEAAKYLPKDILEEMMDHNQSLLAEQTTSDTSRRTVPVIEEESEECSDEGEAANPLGILKKDEPTSVLIKNPHQVKFASEVLEFNLTNQTFESTNSSKDSLIVGEPTPNYDREIAHGDAETGLHGPSAGPKDDKEFEEIAERIAELEARMTHIGDKDPTQIESASPRIPSNAGQMSPENTKDDNTTRNNSKPRKSRQLGDIEDGDIIPQSLDTRSVQEIPLDQFEGDSETDPNILDDNEENKQKDERDRERSNVLRDIDQWQTGQESKMTPASMNIRKNELPRLETANENKPSPSLTSPRSPTTSKIPKLKNPPTSGEGSPRQLSSERKYSPRNESGKLNPKTSTSPDANKSSKPHTGNEDPPITNIKTSTSKTPKSSSQDEPSKPNSKISDEPSKVPLFVKNSKPLQRIDSKINEDLIPSESKGQTEAENDLNFDEFREDKDSNRNTPENKDRHSSPNSSIDLSLEVQSVSEKKECHDNQESQKGVERPEKTNETCRPLSSDSSQNNTPRKEKDPRWDPKNRPGRDSKPKSLTSSSINTPVNEQTFDLEQRKNPDSKLVIDPDKKYQDFLDKILNPDNQKEQELSSKADFQNPIDAEKESKNLDTFKSKKPNFVNAEKFDDNISDLWPEGKPRKDDGYIIVKDAPARQTVAGKTASLKNTQKATRIGNQLQAAKIENNETSKCELVHTLIANPNNTNELIENPDLKIPIEEEDLIPMTRSTNQEKEPGLGFMDSDDVHAKPGDDKLPIGDIQKPRLSGFSETPTFENFLRTSSSSPPSTDPLPFVDEIRSPFGNDVTKRKTKDDDRSPNWPTFSNTPDYLEERNNPHTPTYGWTVPNTSNYGYPTSVTEYPNIPYQRPFEDTVRTSSPDNSQKNTLQAGPSNFPSRFLTNSKQRPETTERSSQIDLNSTPVESVSSQTQPQQINLNIDVNVRNNNEPKYDYNHDFRPSYSSGTQNQTDFRALSPINREFRKTKETQTFVDENLNSSQLAPQFSDSNSQNQSREGDSMYLIEYRYLPGVQNDPTIEDLEMKCSKALGETNGLLTAADQISPPGTPKRYSPSERKPRSNIISISATSSVRNTFISRQRTETDVDETRRFSSLPRNGIRSSTNPMTARYQALYPNLLNSSNSDCDSENCRTSQLNLANSIRNLKISANKALLDQKTGNRVGLDASPRIPSEPVYTLSEFKLSRDNLDHDNLTCQCYDSATTFAANRSFNSENLTVPGRPMHADSNPRLNDFNLQSTKATNTYQNGNLYHSTYRTSAHHTDHQNGICTCEDDYNLRNHAFSNNSNLLNGYYPEYNTNSQDYFFRSRLTKTPYYRQSNDPCCRCVCEDHDDDDDGNCYGQQCPMCVLERSFTIRNGSYLDP